MKIIVCLDDNNGMLFNKRRLSRDSALRQKLLDRVGTEILWMNGYSADQFTEASRSIRVDEDFLSKAKTGEYCFIENTDIAAFADMAEELIIYRWNRSYPSDVKFPLALFEKKRQLLSSTDFAGSSHDRITEEVYG